MATVTQETWNSGSDGAATVSFVYDGDFADGTIDPSATGDISRVFGTVKSGTVTMTVTRSGKPTISVTKTADWTQNVPAGYSLTRNPRGGWSWTGTAYEINWHG